MNTQLGSVAEQRSDFAHRRSRARVALGAIAICFVASPAAAFRTGADLPELATSAPVSWAGNTVTFQTAGETPKDYEIDGLDGVVRDAAAVWTTASCGALAVQYLGAGTSAAQHGDGVNTISFVTSGWGSLSPKEAAATTDIIYEHHTSTGWRIVEADIYINAQDYTWTRGSWDAQSKDLYTVLEHEMGHALGLLHPCEIGGGEAPDCATDASFSSSIMYPAYQLGERPLSIDDRNGLCFLYGCDSECAASPKCDGGTCTDQCDGGHCPTCGAELECASDQCRSAPECRNGKGAPVGDPCSRAAECASGLCEGGYCASSMSTNCDGGGDCAGDRPLGAACDHASDCAGGECLIGAKPHSICTRACGPRLSACPSDWMCEPVAGTSVCTPSGYVAAGGCAFGGASPRGVSFFAALALAGCCFRRVRHKIERRVR